MANTIILDLSNPDLAPLKEKAVGDTCDLTGVTVEVTANDGKTLTGTITEAELGDEYDAEPADSGDSETAADKSSPDESGESGMAMAAMGMKKKGM